MTAWGSATEHARYSVKRKSRRSGRRKCRPSQGCHNPCTHAGMANGLCLMIGCEFHVAMWVRDPLHVPMGHHRRPGVVALRERSGVCIDDDCDLSGGYAHAGPCEPCGCKWNHAVAECPLRGGPP